MARRIAERGVPTTVWARRAEVTDSARSWGLDVAISPAAVGKVCDVVGICVFDAEGVDQVLFGPDGVVAGMTPGGVVAVHTTVTPGQIRAVAERAARSRVTVLDAPVSGGGPAATAGGLLVMLAGPDKACNRAMPVLETFAKSVVRLGEVGNAQLAKLLNNALFAAQFGLVNDALRIGQRQGLGHGLTEVFRTGSARSFAVDVLTGAGSLDRLAGGQFGRAIGKDVALLAESLADDEPSALLNAAEELSRQMALARGGR